jgi:trimeric autotransporter adhesin
MWTFLLGWLLAWSAVEATAIGEYSIEPKSEPAAHHENIGEDATDAMTTPTNAMEALTAPYSMSNTTLPLVYSTISSSIIVAATPGSSSTTETFTGPTISDTDSSSTPSSTTLIATLTQPSSSTAALTTTLSLSLSTTTGPQTSTNSHQVLVVYGTPVIAGSSAIEINGATYSLALSGTALYVDGSSVKVPWATTSAAVLPSGGGGGFVTAIASALTSVNPTTTVSGMSSSSSSDSMMMVATATESSASMTSVGLATSNGVPTQTPKAAAAIAGGGILALLFGAAAII